MCFTLNIFNGVYGPRAANNVITVRDYKEIIYDIGNTKTSAVQRYVPLINRITEIAPPGRSRSGVCWCIRISRDLTSAWQSLDVDCVLPIRLTTRSARFRVWIRPTRAEHMMTVVAGRENIIPSAGFYTWCSSPSFRWQRSDHWLILHLLKCFLVTVVEKSKVNGSQLSRRAPLLSFVVGPLVEVPSYMHRVLASDVAIFRDLIESIVREAGYFQVCGQ